MFNIFKRNNLAYINNIVDKKSIVRRYISFCIGCLLVAIAFNLFLAPNELVPGGVSGIAILIENYLPINKSLIIFTISIFLLMLSYFLLGKQKTRGSVLGTILFPIFVELTSNINSIIRIDTSQILVSAIFAGVICGFGSGLIFKAGFTTGGTDILNQIMSKYLKISMGKSIILTDGTIVLLSGFVFGINNLLYSIIALYIISYMSDRVILGISDNKAFYIIADKEDEIKDYIINSLGHGATVFKAKGGYNKEKETVLMCVLPTKDYYKLKEGINAIDPGAFFVVTDSYEVFGGE